MFKNKNTVCIIPARGGSKRIPRKNITPLNGIPLLSYTIRAALASGIFDEIYVSTEDSEIAELAINENVLVDYRPLSLAGDFITKVQVVKEFLERKNGVEKYSTITALLPTCPFRTGKHIMEANDIFNNNPELPFLIGVTQYEFPIQLALSPDIGDVMLVTFEDGYKTTRSQDIPLRFHPNGAIYMATVPAFMENGSFFSKKMLTYKMSAIHSFDIDFPYQFQIAEIIAKNIHQHEY